MIKFDYSIIRKALMGVAQESLNALYALLPLRLGDICHSTEKSAKMLLESINIIPNDSNFVEFTKAVKNASDSLDEIIDIGAILFGQIVRHGNIDRLCGFSLHLGAFEIFANLFKFLQQLVFRETTLDRRQ